MLAPIADDAALERTDPVDGAFDHRRALDAIGARAGAVDAQAVIVSAVMQLDFGADALWVRRTTTRRRSEEGRVDHAAVGLIGLDRRRDDGHRVCLEGEGTGSELLVIPRSRVRDVVVG